MTESSIDFTRSNAKPGGPALSVIVVTTGGFRNVRRTIAHLRRQTAREKIELLVVAASEDTLSDRRPEETAGFFAVHFVFTGAPIDNVDRASALAVPLARASHVALIEDHAYPEREWAEHIIEAATGEWAAIGSTVVNANPDSALSWTNLLIAYGPWTEPVTEGEKAEVPGHNTTYRREALAYYGDRLPEMLGRSGGLLDDLQERGLVFYLESPARLAHANPSRLAPTIRLRFCAGRLYAWTRLRSNEWTPLHRVIYTLAGPVIPFLRFQRLRKELFGDGKRAHLWPRVAPGLFFGLILDALGQMAGYALGPGRAREILSVFEMDRMQHLNRRDRRLLSE